MKPYLFFLFCMGVFASASKPKTIARLNSPYILVDSMETSINTLLINPQSIESFEIINDSARLREFGDKGKFGAVIIKTKPNTRLVRIGYLLEQHKVSQAVQHLQVMINHTYIPNPRLILAEPSEVSGIQITTDIAWEDPEDSLPPESFINIISKKH